MCRVERCITVTQCNQRPRAINNEEDIILEVEASYLNTNSCGSVLHALIKQNKKKWRFDIKNKGKERTFYAKNKSKILKTCL